MLALCHALLLADADDVTTYDVKLGFVPGTKPDVDAGFMSVADAKAMREHGKCRDSVRERPM